MQETSVIGQTISHYKILEKLGEGGMGVVYKAHDIKLDRDVALKFLPHYLTSDPTEKERFNHEARAAAALTHANIAVVHEIGEHEGQIFIAMEYVQGQTLKEMVAKEPLSIKKVLDIAIQVCEGLAAAHEKGIVHRDIKSDNIILTPKGQAKITDFGLAKLKGATKLTKEGSTLGTAAYMSPEQAQGEDIDQRSDIFSFGVVLYELLTGKLPFRGEHQAALLYSLVNEDPAPVARFNEKVTPEIEHIVSKALEKDKDDRYQHADEMLSDLRRERKKLEYTKAGYVTTATAPLVSAPSEPTLKPASRGISRKVLLWSGVSAIVIIVAAVVLFVLLPARPPHLNPSMSLRTLDIPIKDIIWMGFSRDGQWCTFVARDSGRYSSLYFMNINKLAPHRLNTAPFKYGGYLEISPDGSEVLYDEVSTQDNSEAICVISSLGGASRKIVNGGNYARWRPDGQRIGYVRGLSGNRSLSGKWEFWTVNPDGSDDKRVFIDSLSWLGGDMSFDWSPDGNSIVWARAFPGYEEIIIHDFATGTERQLTWNKKRVNEFAWASNDEIFFASNKSGNTNIWMIPARGGDAVQVTRGIGPDLAMRVSADGKRLLYLESKAVNFLWTAGIDGSNPRQLTFDNASLGSPSFSPDNKRISFQSGSTDPLHDGSNVFLMNSDGTNRVQLTSGDGWSANGTWSPDGKYLLYASWGIDEPVDSSRMFLVDLANPVSRKFINHGIIAPWIDSDKFVVVNNGFHSFVYSLSKEGPIASSQDSTIEFSLPSGSSVLICDGRNGREGWWIKSGRDAAKQILSNQFSAIASASLRYLLYEEPTGEVVRVSLPDGKRELLPEIVKGLNPASGQITTSSDDKQMLFLKGQTENRLVLIENVFE